jgi:two-component system chemotaxis sensor kinase CheA
MAERNGKLIKPVQIVSSDIIMVDGERYYNFVKVLGHVFRNAVKHGIEEPAQRVKDGKSELGEISFAVKRCHNSIVLEVSDDGRGIDVEKLKETAMNKGLYNAEELNRCEQDDLMRLVFIDGISATDIPDELAGRGEGLAAVLKELQLLGGRVEIDSARNIGTTFKFTLPLD